MDTMPWPPGRDDIRLGVILDATEAGDELLLTVELPDGARACTLAEERRWAVGDRVYLHYAGAVLDGLRHIVRVRRAG